MSAPFYKTVATSLPAAFQLDCKFAQARRGMSVERLASVRGITPAALYKQMEEGTMHAIKLPGHFHDTGGKAVISYLCGQAGGVFIPVPTGRRVGPQDIHALQAALTNAIGALLDFYAEKKNADDCLGALLDGMSNLAWHRENVVKAAQPELELGYDHGR